MSPVHKGLQERKGHFSGVALFKAPLLVCDCVRGIGGSRECLAMQTQEEMKQGAHMANSKVRGKGNK